MNGIQNRKALNTEKPVSGCLGRMVNLFDLSTGVAGNRMLMDRPHNDGSTLARSHSDVVRVSSPIGDKIEDKRIVSELRRTSSTNKANGTPMKMLLDEEMSKEIQSRNDPPNVVAKLMGLDELPRQQGHSSLQRSNTNSYSRLPYGHAGMPVGSWEHEDLPEGRMHYDLHQCAEGNEYKDVYEVWQQPQNSNYVRDKSPHKDRNNTNANDKKMALVRQKFMEAKRLATDEKLRQSKEFQDALEVLSSNRELFLKFLQEPNSLFSEHLYELRSIPPPTETKRITVLRPSKIVDCEKISGSKQKSDKQMKKPAQPGHATAMWDKSKAERSPLFSNLKVDEYPIQPTRIVVLKPSTGKTHDIRAVVASPSSSPRVLHGGNIYEDPEDVEAQESREVAKQITRHMRDNLMGHRRDETLLSSVFSNGYTGDESSFNKSENEFAAENLSDSEVLSPSSRHSWDYINRLGSPFSSSSFSRASCSPESSVCREAKKRLSERWAMVASNGILQEPKHVRRSSSTLGEMLALSDIKKPTGSDHEIQEVPESKESVLCVTGDSKVESICDSPRSLSRSKSVPELSTVFDKTDAPKELTKAKSTKSSFKGKVSSLFFSRSKKCSKEKPGTSGSRNESQSASETPWSAVPHGKIDAASQSDNGSGQEECLPPAPSGPSGKFTIASTNMNLKQGIVPGEAGLSLTKPKMPGNTSENQDQPSPISVLEPSFEEDDIIREASAYLKPEPQVGQLLRSNLIDKSPPIESIARTLSWDDSCVEAATSSSSRPFSIPTLTEEGEEYWLTFVQTLLSSVGLDANTRCDSCNSVFPRWQSPEAPLDPCLRDKYANVDDKEPLHEAKRRQLRSTRKLVFDRVNAVLADITTGYESDMGTRITWCGARERLLEGGDSALFVDRVWGRMREWFIGEVRCFGEDCGDMNSLVVDGVLRKEVVGRGWTEVMRLEIDNLGKEIERKLLEELVEEVVVDLTGKN